MPPLCRKSISRGRVDAQRKAVGPDNGEAITFALVWAAGGDAGGLARPGGDPDGVHTIRTKADIDRQHTVETTKVMGLETGNGRVCPPLWWRRGDGGKGANLDGMASIGLPVPRGFTITTEMCTRYYAGGGTYCLV